LIIFQIALLSSFFSFISPLTHQVQSDADFNILTQPIHSCFIAIIFYLILVLTLSRVVKKPEKKPEKKKQNPENSMSNLPAPFATRDQWPSGLVYVEDFLTEEEQELVLKIVEENGFDQHVHRRQQFFGPKYYHTPQSYRDELQPVDSSLATDVLGVEVTKNDNNSSESIDSADLPLPNDSQTENTSVCGGVNQGNLIGAQNLRHNISQFEWLIEKLIKNDLFERADVRDPFVEYINVDNRLQRVERDYINPLTSPLSVVERDELEKVQKLTFDAANQEQNDENDNKTEKTRPEWGPRNTLYPDQILVNEYLVTQNIGQHFDDHLCFGPLIVGVSCGDDCTLILSRPQCIGKADRYVRGVYEGMRNVEKKKDNFDLLSDIEDLDRKFYECHKNDYEFISEKKQGETHHNVSLPITLSYPISLRDFAQPNWREGLGHELLTQYCRCTRDRFLEKYHPYGKILTNLKRHQEFNLIQQFPTVGNKVAVDLYSNENFFQENVNFSMLKCGEDIKNEKLSGNKHASGGDCGDCQGGHGEGLGRCGGLGCGGKKYENEPSMISFESTTGSRKKPIGLDTLQRLLEWAQERYDKITKNKIIRKNQKNGTPKIVDANNDSSVGCGKGQDGISTAPIPVTIYDFDVNTLPIYLQDIICLIFAEENNDENNDEKKFKKHPTTEEELASFVENFDYRSLLENYYTNYYIPGVFDVPPPQFESTNNQGKNDKDDPTTPQTLQTPQNVPQNSLSTTFLKQQLQYLLTPNIVDINTCTNCDDTLYIPVKKGSVYVLAGAARYQYRHAIKKLSKSQQKDKTDYRRVSLTVRSLLPGRRQVAKDSSADHDLSQYNYTNGENE
jgi:alkylated DNA repair dioxygenase AlkB